jgi:hypothetical protein
MKTKLLSLVAIAIAATAAFAASASAATTASLSALSTAATPSPGCQPKGLWASNVSGVGSLGAGTYRYAVTANGTSSPACPSLAITVPASAAVALQWNPTPGASGYTIYRSDTTDANLKPFTPASPSCPSKCVAFDAGLSTPSGSPPALAVTSLQAGDHTDTSIVQAIDYGNTPNDNSDDPISNNPADVAPPALKTDVIHLPVGFIADPSSASATCTLSNASGASLLGSLALHGRQDPNEDTCPAGSLLGSVQALTRTPGSVIALIQGDIFAGVPLAGESARFLIALRPLCSFHNPVSAPNSTLCNAQLGPTNNELDTGFLSVKATPGVNATDLQTFDISTGTDQPLPSSLPVRNSSGTQVGAMTVQVRRLTQTLFGYADQGSSSTADDTPFVTLPTCGVTEFTADLTTYADASNTSATFPFTSFSTCASPLSTTPPAAAPAPTPTKKKCKKGRKLKHGKCVKKKKRG